MTRGPNTDESQKDTHVSVRLAEDNVEYLDRLGEELGFVRDGDVNRSQTLRTVIKSHNGLLFGRFFALLDSEKLADEWGDVGELLAAAKATDGGLPDQLSEARLADVTEPVPVMVAAAHVELEEGEADATQ